MGLSRAEKVADILADVLPSEREEVMLELFPSFSSISELDDALAHDWSYWGRPEQQYVPGPETYTAVTAGRGFGKTALGAHASNFIGMHPEFCGGRPAEGPDDVRAGQGARIAVLGRTANDVNQTMIDGDSGIMASCDPALRPKWHKQNCTLTYPTGVVARLMSADVPDSLRGPNIGWFWADELAHYRRLAATWKQLTLTHRIAAPGQHPRGLITTTPLGLPEIMRLVWQMRDGAPISAPRGTPLADVVQGYLRNPRTHVITGSSYDNVSNLAGEFLTDTVGQYEGTADGDQEVHGMIKIGVQGALWDLEWIQRCEPENVPKLDRIAVFVDPTVSDHETVKNTDEPCECGIVTMGFHRQTRRGYVLADASLTAAPSAWATRVIDQVIAHGATEVVCEDNQGGGLLRIVLEYEIKRRRAEIGRRIKITLCKATVKDKGGRAALAAPMWEQGKVWHVGSPRGFVALESQFVQFDPNKPSAGQRSDRMDAAVWGAITFFGDGTDNGVRPWALTDGEAWRNIESHVRR